MPEIVVDIAAVRQGDTALAIGDLFGSSMANMLILGIADLMTRGARLMTQVAVKEGTVGVLAMTLTAVAAGGILAGEQFVLFGAGWAPITIAAAYILGVRLIHTNRGGGASAGNQHSSGRTAKRGIRRPAIAFAIVSVVILVAGPYLARSAGDLAEKWGIGSGFSGWCSSPRRLPFPRSRSSLRQSKRVRTPSPSAISSAATASTWWFS